MPPPRTRRGASVRTTATPQEAEIFFPDTEMTPGGKNDRLADVLSGTSANQLAIVSIKRLEIGAKGWLIRHR